MQEEATLNLKWDSFSSQLTNSLDACYEKQFFVDLSLVCKNGTVLKCHKMVLANASSFFRRLLVRNDHPHPMIILHDIEADDLKTIINFMYCGEIQVVKSEVKRILKVAEILQVSGLKDIRSKILAPETNSTSRDTSAGASSTDNASKVADTKSHGKTNMESETGSSTSSFARRLPIVSKCFTNFSGRHSESGRGNESHAKPRGNFAKKHENIAHETQLGNSGRITANSHRTINMKPNPCTSDKFAKKRIRNDEPITWTKVLSEISKETSVPLKRLCVMDEVEITASEPMLESPLHAGRMDNSSTSRNSPERDPLDTSGIYIKQEIDVDTDGDDDYDSNMITSEREEAAEPRATIGASSFEIFRTVRCTSGVVTLTPKSVNPMEVTGRKDSSG